MRISEEQKEKLKKAFESKSATITNRIMFADINGEHVIAVTKSQCDRLADPYEANKGLTINCQRHN